MNSLHLGYLRDTGKKAGFDAEDLRIMDHTNDSITDEEDEAISNFLTNHFYDFDGLVTQNYVQWLEDKINN